jgi:hypothetical protein
MSGRALDARPVQLMAGVYHREDGLSNSHHFKVFHGCLLIGDFRAIHLDIVVWRMVKMVIIVAWVTL